MKTVRDSSAFTLIELVIAMLVIVVLATMLVMGSRMIGERAYRTQAHDTIQQIYNACDVYHLEQGRYPYEEIDEDASMADDYRMSFDKTVTSWRDTDRPRILNAIYSSFAFSMERLGENDELLDPWGSPYIYQNIHSETGVRHVDSHGVQKWNGGKWWKDRGVLHQLKIYSVGGTDNFDAEGNLPPPDVAPDDPYTYKPSYWNDFYDEAYPNNARPILRRSGD